MPLLTSGGAQELMLHRSSFRIRTLCTSGLSFGLAKATTFVVALALPRLVDPDTYGVLELAMTIGIFGATVLGLNAHTAAIRLHLLDNDPRAQTILAGQCFCLAIFGLIAAGCAVMAGREADYVLCTAILGLFAVQLSASAYVQMRGLALLSGWADGIAILVVGASAIVLSILEGAAPLGFAWTVVTIALVAAGTSATTLFGVPSRELWDLVVRTLKIGGPITLYSLATLSVFGSSRIAIAQLLSISDVASFSLCLRLALVLFLPHQLLGATFFAQLYRLDGAVFGRMMAVWIVLLSTVAAFFAVAAQLLSPWLVVGTQVPAEAIAGILPAVTVQAILWILNANLEMFINREFLSRQAALDLGGLTLAAMAVGSFLYVIGDLSLPAVVHVYIGLMLASLIAQMKLLSRKGFRFGRCYLVLPIVAMPLLASLLPVLD